MLTAHSANDSILYTEKKVQDLLVDLRDGKITRQRCHILGHVFMFLK